MAFDFPSSPTTGQTYSVSGGPTYVYNGTAWVVLTPGNQFNRTVFTATAGQTTFTMNYVVGAIDVYRNGVKLVNTSDFTATNGTSIVLLNAATVGDTIEVISYPMITYSDAVKRTGDTMTGNLNVIANVGIGTSSPQSLLDLAGNDPTIRLNDTDGSPASVWSIRSTDGRLAFRDVSSGADRLIVDASGNLQFNSGYGAVATAYGCRAYAKFSMQTSPFTISNSANISSITDNGVGEFTLNFANAFPNNHYSIVGGARPTEAETTNALTSVRVPQTTSPMQTNTCRMHVTQLGDNGVRSDIDSEIVTIAVFM